MENAGIDGEGQKLVPYSFQHTTITSYRLNLDDSLVQAIMGYGVQKMTEWYDQPNVIQLIEQASSVKEKMESGRGKKQNYFHVLYCL